MGGPIYDRQRLIPSANHVDAVGCIIYGHFTVGPAALAHGDSGDDLVGRPIYD